MSRNIKRYVFACVVSLLCAFPSLNSYADLTSDMNGFFNNMGFTTNATNPTSYNGQSAHYYSGGRIFARAPVHDIQLATVQLPSLRAGCNGIDAFGGAFSFVNADQLVAALKNIGSNAVGYAFQLALAVLTPEINGVLKNLQTWANRINSFNRNSCQLAQQAVDGLLQMSGVEDNASCINQGLINGVYKDYADAKQKCGHDGETNATNNALQSNPSTSNKVWHNYNLSARVMATMDLFKSDPEMQDIGMSIAGTITRVTSGTDNADVHVLPPILTTEGQWKILFGGGDLTVYSCNPGPSYTSSAPLDSSTNTCLDVVKTALTINNTNSFQAMVMTRLDAILNDIKNNTPLAPSEQIFLTSTRLPVMQMMKNAYAYNENMAISLESQYAEVIGLDIIRSYMSALLRNMLLGVKQLAVSQNDMTEFTRSINDQQTRMNQIYNRKIAEVDNSLKMIEYNMKLTQLASSTLVHGIPGLSYGSTVIASN